MVGASGFVTFCTTVLYVYALYPTLSLITTPILVLAACGCTDTEYVPWLDTVPRPNNVDPFFTYTILPGAAFPVTLVSSDVMSFTSGALGSTLYTLGYAVSYALVNRVVG